MKIELANTLVSALQDPEQRIQLVHVWTYDLQNYGLK